MKPVTLTTERLVLRPFDASDAPAVYAACQEPDIPRWTTVPSPYRREDAEQFTGTVVPEGWRHDTAYHFAVVTRAEGALVGAMGLVRLDRLRTPERQAELGYWTAKAQRGRGTPSRRPARCCAGPSTISGWSAWSGTRRPAT